MSLRGLRPLAPQSLLGFAAAAMVIGVRGRWVNTLGDFGIWFSDVQSLSHGARPMRDVLCPYGPLSPAILGVATRVLGLRVSAVSAVEFGFGLAALFLLLKVSRRFLRPGERLTAAALLASLMLWMPGPGSIVYPYAPAVSIGLSLALGAILAALRREGASGGGASRFVRAAAAGGLAGLAYLTKQEMGAAAALGIAAVFALEHSPRAAFARIGAAALAALAAVAAGYGWFFRGLPFLQAAQHNGLWPFVAIPAAWRRQYTYSTGYGHPLQSLLDVSSAAGKLAAICGIAGMISAWSVGAARPRRRAVSLALAGGAVSAALGSRARGSLFSAAPLIAVAALAAALLSRRARGSGRAPALGALAAASLPLLYRVGFRGWIGGPFASLGYTLIVPLLVWATFRLVRCVLRPQGRDAVRVLGRFSLAAAALAVGFGSTNLVRIGREPEPVRALATPRGIVWMKPAWIAAFERAGEEIRARTAPGESIAILPETHGLDFVCDRRNALPVAKIDEACDPKAEALLLEALEAHRPRLILLFDERSLVFGTSGFGKEYGVNLLAWVNAHYRRVAGPVGSLPSFQVFAPI